jgi:hypothetical protein
MEMNAIMQALVKDLAEQMRPMVVELVRQERAAIGEQVADIALSSAGMTDIAARIDLADLAKYLNLADLAGELTDSQLCQIAGDIDLEDLAENIDTDELFSGFDFAEKMKEVITEFFADNTFSIRP